jgi:hypothetical protein
MDVDKFLTNYLVPSESGLDKSFTMPLPPIPGLKEVGNFILQGNLEDTVSTNIVSHHRSEEEKVRLVEVYKRTQNQVNGVFVRLVGTISVVKKGYPALFLDAAVSNVDPRTAERVDLSTMVAIHVPQADPEKRSILTDSLTADAEAAGLECGTVEIPVLPDFWGPLWHVRTSGAALDTIKALRDSAWSAYQKYCEQVEPKADFDYKPMQDQMVYKNSAAEHGMFRKMGLQVATEAQAAFFSILVTGVDTL